MIRSSSSWVAVALILAPGLAARGAAPDPRLAGYRTPPGWKVTIAATEPLVINPVTMTWGPDARLYVIEWQAGRGPNDHIKVLTDADGDGTFDKAETYMDGLELPAGLCFWDGWTYLTLDHDVVRFHDPDLDGKSDKREAIVTGFGNDDSHHRVSGLTIGPDGWLYMTTGDSDARPRGSDGSSATVLRSGGVFRCLPDGSKLENVAFGMRNPWGNVAFDDEFHIFHTDNDNEGTPGFTGCRILHVVEGGDYGWRLREGARCCAPDFERATWNGGRPGRLGWVAETGRGAPAGLCVLNSAAFPPSTRNLLVYPDVFRKLVRAYKLKPKGATYEVAEEFPLLATDDPLFRPDDAEVGPDGALYILDWRTDSGGAGQLSGNGQTGRIYRVTWGGTEEESARPTLPKDRFVRWEKVEGNALIKSLLSESDGIRRAASLELIRRLRGPKLPGGGANVNEDALDQIHDLESKLDDFLDDKFYHDLMEILTIEKRLSAQAAATLAMCAAAQGANHVVYAVLAPSIASAYRFSLHAADQEFQCHCLAIFSSTIPRHDAQGDCIVDVSKWKTFINSEDGALRRLSCEYAARFSSGGDVGAVVRLLAHRDSEFLNPRSDLRGFGTRERPQVARSLAVALGHFGGLRRANPGETTRWSEAVAKSGWSHPGELPAAGKPQRGALSREDAEEALYALITSDMIARTLMDMACENAGADPFLRDGMTRGLERLGPAGIDALVKAISSNDKRRSEAALYVLQGWRNADGADAILLAATDQPDTPPAARAGLFRALRELGAAVLPDRIAGWLARNPKADPEPRVEAIHVLTAMHHRAALAAIPVLPGLLVDDNGEVRKAALGLAGEVRSGEVKSRLVEVVKRADRPADERRLALAALRGYEDKALVPLLKDLFKTTSDVGLRGEVLRTLGSLDFAAAAEAATSVLGDGNGDLRADAIRLLGEKPETALMVAERFNAGKLPPEDFPRVIEAVRSHATPELQAATQTLLKKTLLAAPTGREAERLREFVRRHGNAERGKALFLDAKKGGCATCHRLEGVGVAVGPDLTRVWETLSFDKRVESILEPSKEIKEGYATVKVATTDGRVVNGLLLADTPEAVTLKDAQGQEVRIPKAEVEQKGTDPTSLMPVGVVGNLSFAELADLLAFLGDRKTQESLRTADRSR